jgi:hypothetical protein
LDVPVLQLLCKGVRVFRRELGNLVPTAALGEPLEHEPEGAAALADDDHARGAGRVRDVDAAGELALRGIRDAEEALVFRKHAFFVLLGNGLRILGGCRFPHFMAGRAIDAVSASNDVAVEDGAVFAVDADAGFGVLDLVDALAEQDFALVFDVVVENLEDELSVEKCRLISSSRQKSQ